RDARGGSREALGHLLDAFRRYLLRIGDAEIRPELRPKGGASDLVQDTFVDAQRGFGRFRGETREEVCAWLRTILLRNLSGFRRHFLARSKRQIGRELSLDDSRSGGPVRDGLAAASPSPSGEASRGEHAG